MLSHSPYNAVELSFAFYELSLCQAACCVAFGVDLTLLGIQPDFPDNVVCCMCGNLACWNISIHGLFEHFNFVVCFAT